MIKLPTPTITAEHIRGAVSPHYATRLTRNRWEASWLPKSRLTRNQAIAAVILADLAASMVEQDADHSHPGWRMVDTLAAELGLAGPGAYAQATEAGEL